MTNTDKQSYKTHELNVAVDQYRDGPFRDMWFVHTQTCNYPLKSIQGSIAHQQNNGPCSSEAEAFDKAFRTLKTFIDDDLARQKGVSDAAFGGDEVGNG